MPHSSCTGRGLFKREEALASPPQVYTAHGPWQHRAARGQRAITVRGPTYLSSEHQVKQPQGSAVTLRRRDETGPVFRRRRPIAAARAGASFLPSETGAHGRRADRRWCCESAMGHWRAAPKAATCAGASPFGRPATARDVAALPCPSICHGPFRGLSRRLLRAVDPWSRPQQGTKAPHVWSLPGGHALAAALRVMRMAAISVSRPSLDAATQSLGPKPARRPACHCLIPFMTSSDPRVLLRRQQGHATRLCALALRPCPSSSRARLVPPRRPAPAPPIR
jgi:hypothetical protein